MKWLQLVKHPPKKVDLAWTHPWFDMPGIGVIPDPAWQPQIGKLLKAAGFEETVIAPAVVYDPHAPLELDEEAFLAGLSTGKSELVSLVSLAKLAEAAGYTFEHKEPDFGGDEAQSSVLATKHDDGVTVTAIGPGPFKVAAEVLYELEGQAKAQKGLVTKVSAETVQKLIDEGKATLTKVEGQVGNKPVLMFKMESNFGVDPVADDAILIDGLKGEPIELEAGQLLMLQPSKDEFELIKEAHQGAGFSIGYDVGGKDETALALFDGEHGFVDLHAYDQSSQISSYQLLEATLKQAEEAFKSSIPHVQQLGEQIKKFSENIAKQFAVPPALLGYGKPGMVLAVDENGALIWSEPPKPMPVPGAAKPTLKEAFDVLLDHGFHVQEVSVQNDMHHAEMIGGGVHSFMKSQTIEVNMLACPPSDKYGEVMNVLHGIAAGKSYGKY